MAINKIPDLEYIVKNEHFINCSFLPTSRFIDYCDERGISTSFEQLERFEELSIFYPIARFRYPTPNKHSIVIWGINSAKQFFEEGYLWSPRERPFQAWETFKGEDVESYYSRFQCYQLYNLIESRISIYSSQDSVLSPKSNYQHHFCPANAPNLLIFVLF